MERSIEKLKELLDNFKQFMIFTTEGDYQILKGKNDFTVKETKRQEREITTLNHNKTKNYILEEGTPIPFLIKLGVMGEKGEVFKDSYNKFRQINKYLEFIDDTIKELKNKNLISDTIKVVDFGCGKSYLTFAPSLLFKKCKKYEIYNHRFRLKKRCNGLLQ